MTVQELINSVLRLIRVLDSGETPTATESNDALAALNQLISNWSAAGVPVYQEAKDVLNLSGQPSYTIGTGGQISTTRPVKITAAQVVYSGISMPVQIVNSQRWTQSKDRNTTSKFAQELYYDAGFPVGSIALWPIVSTGSSLELFSLKPLTGFAALDAVVNLPPGYEQALKYGLAAVLAPEYGSALPPEYVAVAGDSKAAIASMNGSLLGQTVAPAAPAG